MRPTALFISNIRWNFVWQRHQTLASLFARDYEVVFCEIPGVRRPELRDAGRLWRKLIQRDRSAVFAETIPTHLRIAAPGFLPAIYGVFCASNQILVERWLDREIDLRKGVDLIVNYSAARTALQLIERIPHKKLVYDCTDDWLAVRGIPPFLPGDEQRLLQMADLTLVPSRVLLTRKQGGARRCVQLPHGALVDRFLVPPRGAREAGRLVLLYYGHLHRQHLDFELLNQIAQARPAWRIILVGPVKTPYQFPVNVVLQNQVSHDKLREFVQKADVILLPYTLNRYTEAVMPAKTYECLATGRPVVATPLPELISELPSQLHYARGLDDWVRSIEQAVASDSPEAREGRIALAKANSWESRYIRLLELLKS